METTRVKLTIHIILVILQNYLEQLTLVFIVVSTILFLGDNSNNALTMMDSFYSHNLLQNAL